jgi:EmrB/QacA subfamily drug resistance transporter
MTTTTTTRGARALLSLIVLCTMQAMVVLDGTVVTVALPKIQADLDLGTAGLSWVVNGYLVAFAGLLLLAGRLGDLVGATRVFVTGLALFTVASLVCGFAPNAAVLVTARVAQGVGAATASAVALAILVRLYPDDKGRAWALGVFSFVSAAASSLGFVVGGALTDTWGWRWAFFLNVPIGVVAGVLAIRLLTPERGVGLRSGADAQGALLLTAGLSLGVYAIVSAPTTAAGTFLAWGAASGLLLAAFVWRQRRVAAPLIDLTVLTRRAIAIPNVVFLLAVSAGMGFQYVTALELQQVGGRSPWETSLAFLPVPLTIAVFSLTLSPWVIGRFGARVAAVMGLAPVGLGMVLLSRMPSDAVYASQILPGMVIAGAGMGLVIPAVTGLAMSSAAPEEAGLASGLINTSQQVGAVIGIATMAAVSASFADGTRGGLHDGFTTGYAFAGGFAAVSFLVAVLALRTTRSGAASGTAPAAA